MKLGFRCPSRIIFSERRRKEEEKKLGSWHILQ